MVTLKEMVFNKIIEIISDVPKSLWSASTPYISPGSTSSTSCGDSFGYESSKKMNNLRHCSSLQDLSKYHRIDPEDGKFNSGIYVPTEDLHIHWRETPAYSFIKEKTSQATPFLRKRWMIWLIVLLCLLLFSFLLFPVFQYYFVYWLGGAPKFYVVLDCGSTGTRVYVYQASVNHKKNGNLPLILKSFSEFQKKPKGQIGRAYDRMETDPGLDKLVHNTSGIRDAIRPLLQWAQEQIPQHSHKTTSLFLYATAGIRRLSVSDSKWILDNVWHVLEHSPFLCHRQWVKVITGMEEAYYGWIALNYQTGILGSIPKKATYGALDLGGSSLQVTFETEKPMHEETNLYLRIEPVNHHLSAYSLSGYGLNDAFDKSVIRLLRSHPKIDDVELLRGNAEIKHPCVHSGYKEQYICSNCATTYQESSESPLHGKVKVSKGREPGLPVWLIGAPDWVECRSLAKDAVNLSEWSNISPAIDCDVQPCALRKDLPPPIGHFFAMSGFFVVYRFFNLTAGATLDDVLEKGHEFCDRSWEAAYKSVSPQPFIEQYCFRAPYVVSLLREGLHITDKQITIGPGNITWTLGVALVEAGKAFSARTDPRSYELFETRIGPVLLLFFMLLSAILLAYALLCVGNSISRRFFHRLHIPLLRHNSASAPSILNLSSPFQLQHWSPISAVSGDARVKIPLSPTAGEQARPFGAVHWYAGSNVQLSVTSRYCGTSSVSHSFSSGSLGHMQFDNDSAGSMWPLHRSRMCLQSRRSQYKEDLNSSLADFKV